LAAVTRAIRERPRLAALTAVGLAGLVAVGLAFGLLVGGGEPDATGAEAAKRAAVARTKELRAANAELSANVESSRRRSDRLERGARRQRARAQSWKRRALRTERRNRALRRAQSE
jgi:hypothetical protein